MGEFSHGEEVPFLAVVRAVRVLEPPWRPDLISDNTVLMTRQTVITKKKRGPAPTGKGTLIGVRLQPPMLSALDRWLAEQPEGMSRPDGIRLALKDWLTHLGLLKHRDEPEGAN